MDAVIVTLLSALIVVAGTLGAGIFSVLLKMAERLKGLEMRAEGHAERMGGLEVQVEGLAERMGGLEVQVEGLAERMGGLEVQVEGLADRMGGLEVRMDGFEGRVEGIEKDQKVLVDKLDELLLAQKPHTAPMP